jgi:hypothetical protein
MDFCNECGSKTDPDWVFCRSCGNPLDSPEIEAVAAQPTSSGNSPKVELISRGWDVVDIDATEEDWNSGFPVDLLETDEVVTPLDPDAVEISVDDVTVVARSEEAVPGDEDENDAAIESLGDRWDHLRPHANIPSVTEPSRLPARISQIMVLVAALSALVAAALYFVLNIRLEQFAAGNISEVAVGDARTVAEASLLVMAALVAVSLSIFVWWMIETRPLKPGPAGLIALPAWLGGGVLIGYFAFLEKDTIADALTANSLIVIGLGLVMLASLAAVRMISRVGTRHRW